MPVRPRLSPEALANDSRLLSLINAIFETDATYWRHNRAICKLQLRHQELVSEDGFVAQLEIERAWEEREEYVLLQVVRWAYGEGVRSRGQ